MTSHTCAAKWFHFYLSSLSDCWAWVYFQIKQTPARSCTGFNIPNGRVSWARQPVSTILYLIIGLLCQLSSGKKKKGLTGMKTAVFWHVDSICTEVYTGLREARCSSLAASVLSRSACLEACACAHALPARAPAALHAHAGSASGASVSLTRFLTVTLRPSQPHVLGEQTFFNPALPPSVSTSPPTGWTVSSDCLLSSSSSLPGYT